MLKKKQRLEFENYFQRIIKTIISSIIFQKSVILHCLPEYLQIFLSSKFPNADRFYMFFSFNYIFLDFILKEQKNFFKLKVHVVHCIVYEIQKRTRSISQLF